MIDCVQSTLFGAVHFLRVCELALSCSPYANIRNAINSTADNAGCLFIVFALIEFLSPEKFSTLIRPL